ALPSTLARPSGSQWGSGSQRPSSTTAACGAQRAIEEHMLSTQQKFSVGYLILALLGLVLIQTVFFTPQSENLSYRDFKTLLKAGKVVDLTLKERTMTGRLTTDGLEGLLPKEKMQELHTAGKGEQRF